MQEVLCPSAPKSNQLQEEKVRTYQQHPPKEEAEVDFDIYSHQHRTFSLDYAL